MAERSKVCVTAGKKLKNDSAKMIRELGGSSNVSNQYDIGSC